MTSVLRSSLTLTDADLVTRLGRPAASRLTRLPTSLPNPPVPHIPADLRPDADIDEMLDQLLVATDHISYEPVNPVYTDGPQPHVGIASHLLRSGQAVREVISLTGEHVFTVVPARTSRRWMAENLDAWTARSVGPLTVLAIRGYDAAGLQFLDHDETGWTLRPPSTDGPSSGGGLASTEVVAALLPA